MKMFRSVNFAIMMMLFFSIDAHASYYRNNCEKENLGWNFYCDKKSPIKEEKAPKKEEIQKVDSLTKGEIATKKIEAIRKKHDELLNIATIEPTEENVMAYIKYNQGILDSSSYFAEVATKAIWQNPEINYALKRPTNSVGKRAWIDNRNQKQEETVLQLNERYGVFFLYRSDCHYCHAYSPVLKAFSERYNLKVMAISLNGGLLKEWPETKIDQGQSKLLKITAVPATILFDKKTSEVIPIGFGALSQQELLSRIHTLTKTKPGESL